MDQTRKRNLVLVVAILILIALPIGLWAVLTNFRLQIPVSDTVTNLTIQGEVTELIDNDDGSYDVEFYFTIENSGSPGIREIQAYLNLTNTFSGAPFSITLLRAYGGLTLNSNFNGTTTQQLLSGSDTLAPWQSGAVLVRINFRPNGTQTTFAAPARVTGVIDPTVTSTRSGTGGGQDISSSASASGTVGSTTGGNGSASAFSTATASAAFSASQPGDSTEVVFGIPAQVTSSAATTSSSVTSSLSSSGSSATSSAATSVGGGSSSSSSAVGGVGNAGATSSTSSSGGVFVWPGGKN